MWACLLLLEPVLETGLTKVLRTADHAVRVTKNFFADIAVETFRDWLGKCENISTILRYICCSHLEFVRLKRDVGQDTGIKVIIEPSSRDTPNLRAILATLVHYAIPSNCDY